MILIDPFPLLHNEGQKCTLNGSSPIMVYKSGRNASGIFACHGVGTQPPSWLYTRLAFFIYAISARF